MYTHTHTHIYIYIWQEQLQTKIISSSNMRGYLIALTLLTLKNIRSNKKSHFNNNALFSKTKHNYSFIIKLLLKFY